MERRKARENAVEAEALKLRRNAKAQVAA